ncbi:hypothetical protein QP999_02930 [Corynebacterium sp. MSK004]|uniref:hypothetical protein n=1 Tax=Corynebacterium sp. MSK004 TaxID=3050186 RepID=UPI00254E7576|nr:hypothetical protein [Corynebacterium sp. MSK004]MDK8896896.1 hypothetical protein [Corynebacterium sp. MSK004]
MTSIAAVIFMFALGVAMVLAGIQIFIIAAEQDTYFKVSWCTFMGIVCVAGGIALAYMPWGCA